MRARRLLPVLVLASIGRAGVAAPLVDVEAGTWHECMLDDAGHVTCAGQNEFGQLGDGTTRARREPRAVALPSKAVFLAAGGTGSCAVLDDFIPWCWGVAVEADEVVVAVTLPRKVALSGVVELAMGGATACARLFDGSVQCWGANNAGQLGDGTRVGRGTPASVEGLAGVRTVAVGGEHACAVLGGGTVQCWGWNSNEQLGDGTVVSRSRPVAVVGLSNAVSLGLGLQHSCAVLADGRVACWGRARRGQLGNGGDLMDPSYRAEPAPVFALGITDAVEVAAGGSFTCVRHRAGTMSCFGANESGQLGDASSLPRALPGPVTGLSGVVAFDLGRESALVVRSDGRLWRWGWLGVDDPVGVARSPVAR